MTSPRYNEHRLPKGRHGLPASHVAENQRWRLVGAAGQVLLACGYGAVTSRAISKRAGVSSATFYKYFDDADACLAAAHQMAIDALWDLVSAACTGPGDWAERLRASLEVGVGFLVAEPSLARLLCADLTFGAAVVADAREQLLDRLAGLLCAGRQLRLNSADQLPANTEAHLAAATLTLVGDRILAGELEALPALVPELAEILAAPYRGTATG